MGDSQWGWPQWNAKNKNSKMRGHGTVALWGEKGLDSGNRGGGVQLGLDDGGGQVKLGR